MQFQFRSDDGQYIIFNIELAKVDDSYAGPSYELASAVVTDSKLSDTSTFDLIDVAAQIVDAMQTREATRKPSGDWFTEEWLPATRTSKTNEKPTRT